MSYGGDDSSYGVCRYHVSLWINGVTDKCSKSSGRQQGGGYGGGGDSYGVSTQTFDILRYPSLNIA